MTAIVHGQGMYLLKCHHVMVGCSRVPPDCLVTVHKRLTVHAVRDQVSTASTGPMGFAARKLERRTRR